MQHPYSDNDNDDASSLGSKSSGFGDEGQSVTSNSSRPFPRIFNAGIELESLCRAEISGGKAETFGFPPLCLPIARLLAGNQCCVDCGEERSDLLKYASIGFGTILCQDCAHRHVTESGEESQVKHLRDEHWSLRSTLAIFEGGNTQMLDYVKHKPRWRPPKGKSNESYSEDILAFKQVYLSNAAATYRKLLSKKVDAVFYARITAMRKEDAAKEKLLQTMDFSRRDPFQQIFEQNNMSGDEIPGFFTSDSPQANDSGGNPHNGEGEGVGDNRVISPENKARIAGPRKGRNLTAPLMKHEAPNIDLIKQRIKLRRASINANQADELKEAQKLAFHANITSGHPTPRADGHASQRSRWRPSDHVIGELGDTSIHDQYGDHASVDRQQLWSRTDNDDEQTMISYSSRSYAKKAPIGMYHQLSTGNQLDAQRGICFDP